MATYQDGDISLIEGRARELQARLQDEFQRLTFAKRIDAPYSEQTEELDEEDKRGVMRLDYAIYALHLATARIFTKTLSRMMKEKIQRLERKLVEKAGMWAIKKAGWAALSKFATVASFLVDMFDEETLERETEAHIRRGCARTLREMPGVRIKPKKPRGRRMKSVLTRNPKRPKKNGRRI